MALQPTADGTGDSAPALHYVDWGAIIAGAVIATAVAIVMFTFGAAIGLSMVSPYEGEGVSTAAWFATLGLWTVWVIASSFMAGGYVTGRMRRRVGDGTEHEVDVRDGTHGVVVWALGIVLASWLLGSGITGVLGTATKTAGAAAGGAAAASAQDDRTAFTIDSLFRKPPQTGQVAVTGASAASSGENGVASRMRSERDDKGEARRLLMYGMAKGDLTAENKAALTRVVADHTGMSQADAEQRVSQVIADAKKTADKARKSGVLLGFLTAAALLVGGAAAAWAATLGGRHRDQNVDHSSFWRWA